MATYCDDVCGVPGTSLAAFLTVVHGCGCAGSTSLTEALRTLFDCGSTNLLIHNPIGFISIESPRSSP